MSKVILYSKENCPYCHMAKELLSGRGIAFEEIRIDLDPSKLEEMIRLSNKRTVPQIFINNQSIGGYDDLTILMRSGKLDELLKTT
jgi:glutaredoxin 3